VDACVDRAEVEVGGLVSALHAEVRGGSHGELFASGGRAVAGVFVLPGCSQCGLGVRQQSAPDLVGDLVGRCALVDGDLVVALSLRGRASR